jgi:hypothetical protein
MKAYWGSGGTAPRIPDLETRWRWVVSFTPRPFYPQSWNPWYSLDRRLSRPQSRSALWLSISNYMSAVCKIRGLTLLLRVGALWRRGDGLFFEVLPSPNNSLLTTLHPLLENVLQTVDHFEISCLGPPFSWLEKPRNCVGRDLNWILVEPH